jgi:hypothetical protein
VFPILKYTALPLVYRQPWRNSLRVYETPDLFVDFYSCTPFRFAQDDRAFLVAD